MNRALAGAKRKGEAARIAGEPRRAPYSDTRTGRHLHMVTFARGFIRAWLDGWDEADARIVSSGQQPETR